MLRSAGYEVQLASSGRRALDVLEHRRVDLVVSEFFLRDILLPVSVPPCRRRTSDDARRVDVPELEVAHASARWANPRARAR